MIGIAAKALPPPSEDWEGAKVGKVQRCQERISNPFLTPLFLLSENHVPRALP
jgi:hypothetical protein